MKRRITLLLMMMTLSFSLTAGNLEGIRVALEQGSVNQMQEKVYIHTDNQCYFVGDTLWYKAYVVQAGTLQPTDMSRMLYVELLSPDGLLVERQTIVISPKGYTCGQFELRDSLYSGYYELRAYTRWMLNFNVSHHRYSTTDKWAFFNKQMANDFYRLWDGLYSRVLPVYSKPEKAGDYDVRRMYQRPKQRVQKPKKDDLIVNFYPEGGHLVKGIPNNVAFDIVNQLGEAVNLKGTLTNGDASQEIKTEFMGRGSFTVTPGDHRLKAHFTYKGKKYSFSLSKAEDHGVAIQLKDSTLVLAGNGLQQGREYAVSVLCRGVLQYFEKLRAGAASVTLPFSKLPTGVNDVTIFNDEGQILADRLFFVNHHEQDHHVITASYDPLRSYEAYEKVEIPLQCEQTTEPVVFSLSVRDSYTDEPTYDNGNIMTDLLLSSDLRGFIARPAYYFERDDADHRRHLDLLMQVQGWRKYKWQELADTSRVMRYQPEKGLTVEGMVHKMISINEIEPEEIDHWLFGNAMVGTKQPDSDLADIDPFSDSSTEDESATISNESLDIPESTDISSIDVGTIAAATADLRSYGGTLRHDVLVEAEMNLGTQFVGSVQKTDKGHFLFYVPAFYGDGYLNIKAYKESDSIKKNMTSRQDAKVLDEDAYPDFYVKRELFFPMFTRAYDFYQNHQPDIDSDLLIDSLSELSMENDVHALGNVTVKGHRRGKRAIDWKKPAFVVDAYEMYNDMTDRGLSYGKLDMRLFPVQVCRYLFGNMNRYRMFNVDGRLEGHTYYRNYNPLSSGSAAEIAGQHRANRTPQWYLSRLKLKRLQDIRVFTDYEPRNEDSTMVESASSADATVDLVLIPDDGKQVSFRDRHILFHGFNAPEAFYQPDYSTQHPAEPTDYRRTLYWNPNAVTDENGRFTVSFYNNSKRTRIKITAAGVTSDGRLLHSK